MDAASRKASGAEFVGFLRHGIASIAVASLAATAWGADALFVPLDEAEASRFAVSAQHLGKTQLAKEPLVRGEDHLVRIDRQRLFQTIHAVALRGPVSIALNMADDLELEVVVERTRRTLAGHSLSGRVVGVPGSAMTFAANGEVVVGTVWTPRAIYEIVPLKEGVHVFRKVAPSAALPLGEPVWLEGGSQKPQRTEQSNADGGATVDVLVVWTPKARENIESIGGGEAEMRTGVDLLVAWTNDAYERSGAEVRLRLVGAEEIDYAEEDVSSATHLDHLANPSDGFMDGVHARRDALGADLVSLLPGTGTVGGKAFLDGPFSLAVLGLNPSFGVLASTFAHEIGHNLGLSHDRYRVRKTLLEGALRTFSYGYVNSLAFGSAAEDDCWMTIMAYPDRCSDAGLGGMEVPYFATPDRRYPDDDGAPLGVPKSSDSEGVDGPANAVLALNLSYPRVAAFRPGRTEDGDTRDTATQVVANSTTFATLHDPNDIDYFRVALPEAGWLRTEIRTRWRDTHVAIITEGGDVIVERDNCCASRDFALEAELEAGVYFVKVQHSLERGWSSFDYTLVISFNAASAADDHGDGVARASAVAMPSSTPGELQNPSDTDYFRFEVAERGVVRIGTAGPTDVVGVLTSEDGTVEFTDDDSGPQANFLIVAKLSPGIYFVSVRGYSAGAIGAYSLEISQTNEPDDHADAQGGATALAVGASAEGEIEVALDYDLFRIEIPAELGPGQLWAESLFRCATERRIHCDAHVAGELLQDGGEQLARRKWGGHLHAHRFVLGAQVAPGAYFLRVSGSSPHTTGTYGVRVSFIADSRTVPLFLSASRAPQQGFARIINRSRRDGQVVIHAVDDAGERFGPVTLSLAAGRTVHFNSEDLEAGHAAKGLSGGVGAGTGDWRLELETELDIEALAYVRTSDGFLTSMHDSATNWSQGMEEIAAIFNPASNRNQRSRLRLTNQGPGWGKIYVRGFDDRGWTSTWAPLRWDLSVGKSVTMSAGEMEDFNGRFGSLGDGFGKWRLSIVSSIPIRTMNLLESPTGHLTNLTSRSGPVGGTPLPLFLSASHPERESFGRIINRSTRSGIVAIHAIDDAGQRFGPAVLSLAAEQTMHFNSADLEWGNAAKGLVAGVGPGEGDWRLRFDTDLDIEALAYVRTRDGFLTSMNALVPKSDGRLEVVFFNPASNRSQASRLRLVNPATEPATISITGVDDAGVAAPEGSIALTMPADTATTITAQQLEAGADHFAGRFGDGEGKWQLFIEADQDIQAMSLLESETGHLANLSSGTAVR